MMLMNLFSVFDPTSYLFSLNWLVLMMLFLWFFNNYFMKISIVKSFIMKLMWNVNETFSEVADLKYMGMVYVSLVSFMYLMMSNMLGLFPFIFTSTAHAMITMGMGMVMWMSFFLMGWIKNFKMSVAHLVPEGSPMFLSPIMVLIELISHLMRPFTLSIRLAANMMAGHLIVGLLSSISMLNMFSMYSSMFLQSLLLLLELGVAVIQGFVFSILLLLYSLEYY